MQHRVVQLDWPHSPYWHSSYEPPYEYVQQALHVFVIDEPLQDELELHDIECEEPCDASTEVKCCATMRKLRVADILVNG